MKFKNPTFEETSSKEWLLTNGIGGYASTTINGGNTRRYHGLLVASKNPPTQRQVLVSGIEESISERRDTCIEISTNKYSGVIHPQGFQPLLPNLDYDKRHLSNPLLLLFHNIYGTLLATQ